MRHGHGFPSPPGRDRQDRGRVTASPRRPLPQGRWRWRQRRAGPRPGNPCPAGGRGRSGGRWTGRPGRRGGGPDTGAAPRGGRDFMAAGRRGAGDRGGGSGPDTGACPRASWAGYRRAAVAPAHVSRPFRGNPPLAVESPRRASGHFGPLRPGPQERPCGSGPDPAQSARGRGPRPDRRAAGGALTADLRPIRRKSGCAGTSAPPGHPAPVDPADGLDRGLQRRPWAACRDLFGGLGLAGPRRRGPAVARPGRQTGSGPVRPFAAATLLKTLA